MDGVVGVDVGGVIGINGGGPSFVFEVVDAVDVVGDGVGFWCSDCSPFSAIPLRSRFRRDFLDLEDFDDLFDFEDFVDLLDIPDFVDFVDFIDFLEDTVDTDDVTEVVAEETEVFDAVEVTEHALEPSEGVRDAADASSGGGDKNMDPLPIEDADAVRL